MSWYATHLQIYLLITHNQTCCILQNLQGGYSDSACTITSTYAFAIVSTAAAAGSCTTDIVVEGTTSGLSYTEFTPVASCPAAATSFPVAFQRKVDSLPTTWSNSALIAFVALGVASGAGIMAALNQQKKAYAAISDTELTSTYQSTLQGDEIFCILLEYASSTVQHLIILQKFFYFPTYLFYHDNRIRTRIVIKAGASTIIIASQKLQRLT